MDQQRSLFRLSCDSYFLSILLFLSVAIQRSYQDTLSCGATSFQVTFFPSRPQLGVTGGNVGIGSASTSATAKYTYQPIETLLNPGTQVCNLSSNQGQQAAPSIFFDHQMRQARSDPGQVPDASRGLVITRCDNCSQCPQELPYIHRAMTRAAIDNGLASLLVIVGHRDAMDHIKLVENNLAKFVYMDDEPGPLSLCELTDAADNDALKSFSKTSVLFVSISFIILMVISLAWLVHAKDRLQRRLFNAAKKALTRIPTRPVKAGELDSDCPVCIDPYRTGDIVRMLPCRMSRIFKLEPVDVLFYATAKDFYEHKPPSPRKIAVFDTSPREVVIYKKSENHTQGIHVPLEDVRYSVTIPGNLTYELLNVAGTVYRTICVLKFASEAEFHAFNNCRNTECSVV